MAWTSPRTWDPGLRHTGVEWAPILNTEIADNLQFLFDTYTDVRGVYTDISSITLQSTWADIATLTFQTRHEAVLLTLVGSFPAGCQVRYLVDSNPNVQIIDTGGSAKSVAKQWIIPSLIAGSHAIQIEAQGTGTITSFQCDVRELT